MPTGFRALLALLPLLLTACGGEGGASGSGSGSGGGSTGSAGSGVDPCLGVVNQPGKALDLPWPAVSNVGHDLNEGETLRFHWPGSHNVLQVATFDGQIPPTPVFGDAGWPGEIKSGAPKADSGFDWNVGTFECGYRPGIYFFVDEDNPPGGIVSVSLTVEQNSHPLDTKCEDLVNPGAYGGRYGSYAGRAGRILHEVNNFQTEPHFDWVNPTFGATQGDLVLFRWTGIHNVIQVHDATQDVPLPGGITSGSKTNCVGGPRYSCANGDLGLGEYLIDTKNHRPGVIHLSDENAMGGNPLADGMGMEFLLQRPVRPEPPVAGTCCALDATRGAGCRVVEIYNDNEGEQLDYNVPVGAGDLVRFRWSGTLQIYQSVPDAAGAPTAEKKPDGVGMPDPIECVPGPDMGCLGGTQAEFVLDVAAEIKKGNFFTDPFQHKLFFFHAKGENTDGFSSQDTSTILYVDDSITSDPGAKCP
ncbi:MAG: hypothetical protein ABJE95_06170 [Byssovorax sp.]